MSNSNGTASAPKTIQLRNTRTFTRTDADGWTLDITLPAGKTVEYRREQQGNEHIHIATYVDSDDVVWTSEERTPISPTRAVVPTPTLVALAAPIPPSAPPVGVPVAPVVQTPQSTPQSKETASALQATGQVASAAISITAMRSLAVADSEEGAVRRLAAIADALVGDVYQVNYYIPTVLSDRVDNPSRIFRRHGFRLDGSNWVFTAKGLEAKPVQKVIREWETMTPLKGVGVPWDSSVAGKPIDIRVRYWVIKYTRDQLAQMRDMAQTQLADELQKTHRSLIERIDSAAKDLETARAELPADATQWDRAKLESANSGRIRATVTEACERFTMCLKGAEIFDDTGSLDALFGAVRDAIRTQALAVNATLRARRAKGVDVPTEIGG